MIYSIIHTILLMIVSAAYAVFIRYINGESVFNTIILGLVCYIALLLQRITINMEND